VVDQEHTIEHLKRLIKEERWSEVVPFFLGMDPADTADFLEDLESEDRDRLFELLDPETASDVLVEMEAPYVDEVVEDMESAKLANLAERMAPDDAAAFLGELDEEQSALVLSQMRGADDVSELLRYEDDTAGNIMTTEFCAVPAGATVKDAREALVPAELTDPVFFVYVIDPSDERLLGVVSLKQLFTVSPNANLLDIAEHEYVFCRTDEDQEEVARKFRKYDLWVMPVVDEAGRLVGRITVDDIMDVLHEEANEDLALMVGAPDIETEEASPLNIARLRLPWLLITLCAGLLNSFIIKNILDVTSVTAIAIFVPAILAMGGNTGIQSSTIAIRGIALGYRAYRRLLQIVAREVLVGVVLGLACGILTGAAVSVLLGVLAPETGGVTAGSLGLTVGLAMCNAMIFASCYGSIVPVLLHRFGIDPAVASGPFVTTSNDLSASLIYFATCVLLLK
jgi:magnesium transporter